MNALEFAKKEIYFSKSSDISGAFNIQKYRFLEKPLLRLSDITVKEQTTFKASGCMGTVLGQIAMAYRIAREQGDMLFVAQTDADADKWSDTRGREWLLGIKPVASLVRKGVKFPITLTRWLFQHKFLIVTGPGVNAQNSDQVRFLQTDESHLYAPGVLSGFDGRMGDRWMRHALHITTAPDAGHEIDTRYHLGDQNEFHSRCLHCNELIWLLWPDFTNETAKTHYNGEKVFQWRETQSEAETLDSIHVICPHCSKEMPDETVTRNEMSNLGDYVAMNPLCDKTKASYRWSRFAASWLPWRVTLSRWLMAKRAATEFRDLKPHEEFTKKVSCFSYRPVMIEEGDFAKAANFNSQSDWRVDTKKERVGSFDFQQGKKGEGTHWWGQVDEISDGKHIRVIAYKKLFSWSECKAFQIDNGVPEPKPGQPYRMGCDFGHRSNEVFAKCAEYKWLALRSADSEESITYAHSFIHPVTRKTTTITLPYSIFEIQTSLAYMPKVLRVAENGAMRLAPGLCGSRNWSKSTFGFLLLALLRNSAEREYGIPADINPEYLEQIKSYDDRIIPVKKDSMIMKRVLKKIRAEDHAFTTSSQNLVLAIVAGLYTIPNTETTEVETQPTQ